MKRVNSSLRPSPCSKKVANGSTGSRKIRLSAAYALLGESFQRQANVDEVVFGQPEKWKRLMEKAKAAFARAKTLDPENTEASIRAADLGAEPTESP
jgi:hypothetical protein